MFLFGRRSHLNRMPDETLGSKLRPLKFAVDMFYQRKMACLDSFFRPV
jgi:hypothetical protein